MAVSAFAPCVGVIHHGGVKHPGHGISLGEILCPVLGLVCLFGSVRSESVPCPPFLSVSLGCLILSVCLSDLSVLCLQPR